jgi:hypothetical protein
MLSFDIDRKMPYSSICTFLSSIDQNLGFSVQSGGICPLSGHGGEVEELSLLLLPFLVAVNCHTIYIV